MCIWMPTCILLLQDARNMLIISHFLSPSQTFSKAHMYIDKCFPSIIPSLQKNAENRKEIHQNINRDGVRIKKSWMIFYFSLFSKYLWYSFNLLNCSYIKSKVICKKHISPWFYNNWDGDHIRTVSNSGKLYFSVDPLVPQTLEGKKPCFTKLMHHCNLWVV